MFSVNQIAFVMEYKLIITLALTMPLSPQNVSEVEAETLKRRQTGSAVVSLSPAAYFYRPHCQGPASCVDV